MQTSESPRWTSAIAFTVSGRSGCSSRSLSTFGAGHRSGINPRAYLLAPAAFEVENFTLITDNRAYIAEAGKFGEWMPR